MNGAILNYQQLQVLPSKTSIVPVNPVYLPQSHGELEVCSRPVYVTNIDRAVGYTRILENFPVECKILGSDHVLYN